MSSSNQVRVAAIPEVTYGTTPGSGNFKTARFISESLSGTPATVVSQQIRTDRLSSGQVVTGITVGGDLSFELAKEDQIDSFIESAMQSTWGTKATTTVDIDIDTVARELTRDTGDWAADTYAVGDFCLLTAADAENDVWVILTELVSATVAKFVGPAGMIDGDATAIKRADKISIGTTQKSFSMEKKFLDLTTKCINYRGMIVSQMELNVAYGELMTGKFTFSGNDYVATDDTTNMTNGRTVDAPATTDTLNGSVDMPFLALSSSGTFTAADIDIQKVGIALNNNDTPQNAIGHIAPRRYSSGTAQIEMSISAYLKNEAWSMLAKKLSQESFALAFMVQNLTGGYGFYFPAVQVSFDDPASGGANQDVTLEMQGQAKVGTGGLSAMVLYKIPA